MQKQHCRRCGGTGQYMGNGYMLTDCIHPAQVEPKPKDLATPAPAPAPAPAIDKRSKYYRDAIGAIMGLNPDMTRPEAIALFEKTYAEV